MARYSGQCVGGPYDGKPLHHPENRFELLKRVDGRLQAYQPGCPVDEGEQRGAYVHAIDRWEWINER